MNTTDTFVSGLPAVTLAGNWGKCVRTLLVVAAGAALGFASSAAATDKFTPKPTAASIAQHTMYKYRSCPDALSRIIPGAFDYCLAHNRWVRGWYSDSLDLLQRAAAWGSKDAQLALGVAYFNGDHVAVNRPLGLAWLGLAAERHEAKPLQLLASAYGKSTPTERQQAQQLMDSMMSTYGDRHAATRADQNYLHALRWIDERSMYGDGICLVGLTSTPISSMNATALENTVGCPAIGSVVRLLDSVYSETMHGWAGQVTVGAAQQTYGDSAD